MREVEVTVPHLVVQRLGADRWSVSWPCSCGMDARVTGVLSADLLERGPTEDVIDELMSGAGRVLASLPACSECGQSLNMEHYELVKKLATVRWMGETIRSASVRIPE